jgi:DNA-binding NtrC family response regulator
MAAWQAEVVVVDDDADILTVLSDVLRDEGYEPVPFRDGLRAEAHVAEHRPSLVMTDLRLPMVSGRDLVYWLRDRCGADLPIIVMSGFADEAVAEHLPVQGYLHKPFDLDELCDLVERWAGRDLPHHPSVPEDWTGASPI